MKKQKKTGIPVTVLVRQHIIRFCIENGDQSVKLPSTIQYARYFSYSQRTIATVLASLVRDGWIIGKRGVGYYTVPYRPGLKFEKKTVGLVMGDSQWISYDHNEWSLLARPGLEISALGMHVNMPLFFGRDSDSIYKELEFHKLSGLFVAAPSSEWNDALIRFSTQNHPVVTILKKVGNLPMIRMNWDQCGRRLGELANQYHPDPDDPIVWCHVYDIRNAEIYQGFLETCKWKNPKILLESSREVFSFLKDRLQQGKKTALLFAFSSSVQLFHQLYQQNNRDLFNETVVIADNWIVKNIPEYRGLIFGYPHEEIGKTAAMMMKSLFAGEKVRDISLDMVVKDLR